MSSTAKKLLSWYRRHGRDLPWRNTRDPYRILVSEIMLQQTQVKRVLEFYPRWLQRFPDWPALAKAGNAEVIRAWSGLGYNRRGLMLRNIARHIVDHGLPTTMAAWQKLNGIGPYTAAAIGAFSLRQRVLPIDTAIRRSADRLLLGIPFPDHQRDDRLRRAAESFLPQRGNFFDVPQALFDLASSICLKTPRCQLCPLRNDCLSAKKFLSGRVKTPKTMIKKAHERRHRNKPHPDRIYRGRILSQIKKSAVLIKTLGAKIDPAFDQGLDQAWLEAMIERLIKDGLARKHGQRLRLPS